MNSFLMKKKRRGGNCHQGTWHCPGRQLPACCPWSLLLWAGFPGGKAAAAFRLCPGASRLLSSRYKFCKVLSSLWGSVWLGVM